MSNNVGNKGRCKSDLDPMKESHRCPMDVGWLYYSPQVQMDVREGASQPGATHAYDFGQARGSYGGTMRLMAPENQRINEIGPPP
jgi:hypothetical protein